MTEQSQRVRFGLGLVGLGRRWGFRPSPLPSAEEARHLLSFAVELGITVFDTAPAYGSSEALLGGFLRTLPPKQRQRLTIATKLGEHWDPARQATWVDHTEQALRDSLARSFDLLGTIDLLQIHKTTAEVLQSRSLWRVLDAARARGIPCLGASVSDLAAGQLACSIGELDQLQMPYHLSFSTLEPLFALAAEQRKHVWTNRPFASGELLHTTGTSRTQAYQFVLKQRFTGVILTGSANRAHLQEDWQDFHHALGLG